MPLSATFTAAKCTPAGSAACAQGPIRSAQRRAAVAVRAQKQPREEAPGLVYSSEALTNGAGPAVLEKPAAKAPSPAVNVIPVSRSGSRAQIPSSAAPAAAHPALLGLDASRSAACNSLTEKCAPLHRRWADGIPPAMGGHYMVSGIAAPLSRSKGPGIDIAPLYFTYPAGEGEVDVTIYENDFAAANGLADLVAAASAAAVAARGHFVVALSGGSLIKALGALVGRTDVDFSRWWVVFVDERVVPLSSADSNYRAAHEELLRKVPVPSSHVLAIKEGLSPAHTAEHYAGRLLDLGEDVLPRTAGGLPAIDLVLLGTGPDGHVASLFPNRKETAATSGWVLPVTDSPKPPAGRVTLTMPVLNAARHVAVVALDGGKAEVVHRALEVQALPGALPVQLVRPVSGKVTWVLDRPAAAALRVADWAEAKKYPRSALAK
jgi:6-phosphogluconolactonase